MTSTPSRLLLSGGGHRATIGSIGAVAYLAHSDRWKDITEVVSVSGGSIANAALAAAPESADPWSVLADTIRRIDDDHGRVWATRQRTLTAAFAIVGLAGVAVAMAVAVGLGPSIPAVASVAVGLFSIPVAFRIGGRAANALARDFVRVVQGGDAAVPLRSERSRPRTHVFCASGLSSATPYALWTGRPIEPDRVYWGAALQAPYTIVDAALASVSLPFLGRITSPRTPTDPNLLQGGEVLVDGGVSGIFGDQYGTGFRRTPADTDRTDVGVLAIDGGRHVTSPSVLSRRLSRNSVTATLLQWLKTSLEATYVKDLTDLSPERLVRLCESDAPLDVNPTNPVALSPSLALRLGAFAPERPDQDAKERIEVLRTRVAEISLLNLNSARIDDAITSGFVGTLLAFEPAATSGEIDAALRDAGQRLNLDDRLSSVWEAVA